MDVFVLMVYEGTNLILLEVFGSFDSATEIVNRQYSELSENNSWVRQPDNRFSLEKHGLLTGASIIKRSVWWR